MEEELGETSLTYNETVEAIAQFLEAAFHAILYARHIYPRGKSPLLAFSGQFLNLTEL